MITDTHISIAESVTWRLIINSPGDGPWNMAVDEAILESVAKKDVPPTLRLYAWDPYCLSLGHAQPKSDVNRQALKANGWGLVRRPTGGKAILHADELTYAILAPIDEPRVKGTVLESYQRLSKAILSALSFLGIQAEAKPKETSALKQPMNPICFESPSDYEITTDGKKIIGSAQARRLQGVLQHGSIPLSGDITRITHVLNYMTEEEKKEAVNNLRLKAGTLKDIIHKIISWQKVSEALIYGFSKEFNIIFAQDTLSVREIIRAKELVKIKFGLDEWTFRI
jgi:lipoyl(octanoyl) transferase